MKALGKKPTDIRKALELLWKMKMPTPDEASALTAITNRLEEDRTALSEAADELETITNHEVSEFVQDENPITSIKRITRAIRKSAGVKE